jgi:hypothetical protein
MDRERTVMQTVYKKGNIVFLPHYSMPSYFVAPGMDLEGLTYDELINTLYTEEDFKKMGAFKTSLPLWPRPSINIKPI